MAFFKYIGKKQVKNGLSNARYLRWHGNGDIQFVPDNVSEPYRLHPMIWVEVDENGKEIKNEVPQVTTPKSEDSNIGRARAHSDRIKTAKQRRAEEAAREEDRAEEIKERVVTSTRRKKAAPKPTVTADKPTPEPKPKPKAQPSIESGILDL